MSERAVPPPTARLVLASFAVMAPAAFLVRIVARLTTGAAEGYDGHFFSVIPGLLADLRIGLYPTALAGFFGLLAGMALVAGGICLASAVSARRAGRIVHAPDFAGPCRAALRIGAASVLASCVVLALAQMHLEVRGLGPPWDLRANQLGVTAAARLGTAVAIVAFAGAAAIRVLLALVARETAR